MTSDSKKLLFVNFWKQNFRRLIVRKIGIESLIFIFFPFLFRVSLHEKEIFHGHVRGKKIEWKLICEIKIQKTFRPRTSEINDAFECIVPKWLYC